MEIYNVLDVGTDNGSSRRGVQGWVIQIMVGLSGSVGGQEHRKDSGACMEGSFADGRRQQENR